MFIINFFFLHVPLQNFVCLCNKDFAFQVQMLAYWYLTFEMESHFYCFSYLKFIIGFLYFLSSLWIASLLTYYQGEQTGDTIISSKGINHYYAIFSFTMDDGPTTSLLRIIK